MTDSDTDDFTDMLCCHLSELRQTKDAIKAAL